MGDLLAQRLHVSAFAANQDDEVVGVAHDPPVRFAFAGTCAALIPSRHRPAGFPRRVQVLIEDRQRNVGQQRGQDSSNAVGNFCFEVSLSYRRGERPFRVNDAGLTC